MEGIINCPSCSQAINSIDNFCPFCGKKIRDPPPSKTAVGIIVLVLKTILLPPLGFFWGYRYIRQSDRSLKIIGWLVVAVTVVEIIGLTVSSIEMVNVAKQQVDQQYKLYGL